MMMTNPAKSVPDVMFREASHADLRAIVSLLAADSLGQWRESLDVGPFPDAYSRAFDEIAADPRNHIIVAELEGRIAGCLQLTFIPGLTYKGRERALIEAVRVSHAMRGRGLGKAFMEHAIGLARERGCALVQLTTDKRRAEAQAFYRALGFAASHEGMKLWL